MPTLNLSFKIPINPGMVHGISVGQTGTGKSLFLESVMAYYLSKGWKIVDLVGLLGRQESCFPSLPASGYFKKFWDGIFNKTNENFIVNNCDPLLKETYENGFPVHILIPYSKKIPDEIPRNCELYTLGLSDIDVSDFSILFGKYFYGPRRAVMLEAISQIKRTSDLIDLKFLTDQILKRGFARYKGVKFSLADKRTRPSVDRMLIQLLTSGMISSKTFNYSLNLKKELKDKKKITVFLQNYIDNPVMQFFNIYHILRRIYDLLDQQVVKQKILVIVRELSMVAPKDTDNYYQKRTSNLISKIVKVSRGAKLSLWCDAQSPLECNKEILRQMYYRVIFRLWSPEETEYVMLGSSAYLERESRKTIQRLGTGECFIVGDQPKLGKLFPPVWRHYEPGEDFFKAWKQEGRKFKNIFAVKEHIEKNISEGINRFEVERAKSIEEKRQKTLKERGPSKYELIWSELDELAKQNILTLDKTQRDRLVKKYGVKESYIVKIKTDWNKKNKI